MWTRVAQPISISTSTLKCHAPYRKAYTRVEAHIAVGYEAAWAELAGADFVRKAWDMIWGCFAIDEIALA